MKRLPASTQSGWQVDDVTNNLKTTIKRTLL